MSLAPATRTGVYELARDGKSGIVYMPVEKSTQVTSLSIVQNWQREFPKR